MSLFTSFERKRKIPLPHRSTHFQGLNEIDSPEYAHAREFVGEWFERVPENERDDLRARITSDDDGQHQTALFELYLNALLLAMGYEVRRHVKLGDGRIDFLVLRVGEPVFYLEATSAALPDALKKEERRLDDVCDALNSICCSDYWLRLFDHGGHKSTPNLARLRRAVQEWVDGLTPTKVSVLESRGDEATMTWEEGDWRLEISAWLKPEDVRGDPSFRPIGSLGRPARWIDVGKGVRDALRNKANRYGDPGLPYVIAVNMLDGSCRGTDAWRGLLRAWGEPGHPRDCQVSAALMCWLPCAIAAPHETPYLVHHPHAIRPLETEAWPLPQHVLTEAGPPYQLTDLGLPLLAYGERTVAALLGLKRIRTASAVSNG